MLSLQKLANSLPTTATVCVSADLTDVACNRAQTDTCK